MKPESNEQINESNVSVSSEEERTLEAEERALETTDKDPGTPLPEELTEEVVERTAGPLVDALNHSSVSWLHQNDLVDALEKRHRQMTARVQQKPRTTAIIAGSLILLLFSFLIPVEPPHVALAPEAIGPAWLTNSLFTTVIVDIFIILLAFLATRHLSLVPSGLQNVMEYVLVYILDLCEIVAGNKARFYFPWIMTIFLYVIISNWIGLIPGVGSIGFYHAQELSAEATAARIDMESAEVASTDFSALVAATNQEEGEDEEGIIGEGGLEEGAIEEEHAEVHFIPLFRSPSADLNMTFALALITMVMVQVFGVRALGPGYFGQFFVWRGPNISFKLINGFVGILELLSQFSRLIAFGFRLFGNIFAGEIVLATMAFLIAFLLPIPFYMLEIFVGFVQALVFGMLALAFFTIATISHGEHDH